MLEKGKLTVLDFFCGAGGFSEGFRQMGFQIMKGYDNWEPAVKTYSYNFKVDAEKKDILDFEFSLDEINNLPNTDVIIGSPPCVSFSSSNKSGKADKSMGLRLTETFLRIIAVKKHQPNSILKAWFMENVTNSGKYVGKQYTFEDLNLTDWAKKHNIKPSETALKIEGNNHIFNAADYGSFQARRRLITGEIIKLQKLIIPDKTHKRPKDNGKLPNHKTLGQFKESFPHPFTQPSKILQIKDPQFDIILKQDNLTDHFYDTGIYEVEAKFSRHWKVNHPYMGKMSFPENDDKPSRTITATRIANSRESIIYKSEVKRKGNGEYRLPTVREAAVLMGFPITFQFLGSEHTKWRLIGNAVCSTISSSLAKTVLEAYGIKVPAQPVINKTVDASTVNNLNTFILKTFSTPPVKNKGAKFRWHPFKDGNMTVSLTNYRIGKDKVTQNKWFTSIQYGTGDGFPIQEIPDGFYKKIEANLLENIKGKEFLGRINNGFADKIAGKKILQKLFEVQKSKKEKLEPTELIEYLAKFISSLEIEDELFNQAGIQPIFIYKDQVPLKQLYALYAINKITTTTNKN